LRVVQLTDPEQIRSFLETDRYWADYALGDLEPEYFSATEWQGVEDGEVLIALVMLYRGFAPPICFAMGEARGLELLFDKVMNDDTIGLSVREEHLDLVAKHYRTADRVPMWKMGLDVSEFKPVVGQAIRLDRSDVPALQTLYTFGGGDAFSPREVESGVFYGIELDNQLIAAAGTHVVSIKGRVAALGNVMTRPDQRGRGYATIVTSAVCAELIDRGVETIGLSVGRENRSAIRVYEKLGFKQHVPFYEGIAFRKT
jgi:GNAT superfamily N-acetyltransferase